jgi:hypothetical protein
MKRLLFLLFPFLLLNVSCWKMGSAQVDGQVIDYQTKNPVSGADVIITRGYGANGDYDEVDHAKTDGQGHFKIKYFKGRQVYHYYIHAEFNAGNNSGIKGSEKTEITSTKQTQTLSL